MPKEHRPRRGSMGFSPRKRSESPIPHFSSWPDIDGTPKVQGFAGYKAGMTHATIVDYRPTSTTSGQEVQVPVTVVEVPAPSPVEGNGVALVSGAASARLPSAPPRAKRQKYPR